MARLFLVPGLLGGFLFVLWLWALLDVILTDSLLVRNMTKSTWIFLVLFVPTIGAVAWMLFGRPEGASLAPGGQVAYQSNPYRSDSRSEPPPNRYRGAVEDSPGWSRPRSAPSRPEQIADGESLAIRQRKLMEKEAELAKREAELAARETAGSDEEPVPDGDTDRAATDSDRADDPPGV
jgi:hypothetical protein